MEVGRCGPDSPSIGLYRDDVARLGFRIVNRWHPYLDKSPFSNILGAN